MVMGVLSDFQLKENPVSPVRHVRDFSRLVGKSLILKVLEEKAEFSAPIFFEHFQETHSQRCIQKM